jgi:sugar phosphate isomerase/epimerase
MFRLGLNTYSIRALRWHDLQLLEYAAGLKLDAIFLQDSIDPGTNDPAHWKEVKDTAARLGLHLETGGGAVLPANTDAFDRSVKLLRDGIQRAVGMGSPLMRILLASDRDHLPPGPVEQHIETMIRLLKTVRTEALDARIHFAIENHKDLTCWETRQVIDNAGTDFVGSYLDTGNPVFILEDPMQTVETLGSVAVMLHLRDSVVYESRIGIAVQWVPLGEGVVDFKAIIAKAKELCPQVPVYIKPITGRPPAIQAVWDPVFMQKYRDVRAHDFARFVALAKKGHPYESHMVIEDVPGTAPQVFTAALTYQQKEHMERSIDYGKKVLDLGIKWRQ